MTGQPSRAIATSSLVPRAVDEPFGGEPGHQATQLRPHLLDRVLRGLLPELAEVRQAAAVLGDPLVGELARLDVGEDRLHRLARLVADDALAARHVAVLGGVADRVAHVGNPALVDQVDDQLHLVEALEVRHLGRVAGLDQRLEAGADELGQPAAEDRLLAEEIGLGLFLEGGLEDSGARGGGGVDHAEPGLLGLGARGAVGPQPDAHVHAAVAQVLRVGVALAAVADDRDLLAPQGGEVGVSVVVDVHAARSFSFPSTVRTRVPRYIATLPVRTISRMPSGFRSSTSAFTFSSAPVISTT